jgi:hypothetical protein
MSLIRYLAVLVVLLDTHAVAARVITVAADG